MFTVFQRHRTPIIWAVVIALLIVGVGLFSANRAGLLSPKAPAVSAAPRYAAKIDGEDVSIESLDEAASRLLTYYQQAGIASDTFFLGANAAYVRLAILYEALGGLKRQIIVTQEAETRGISVSESAVEAEFQEQYRYLLGEYSLSESNLDAYLQQAGSSLDELKESLRREARLRLLTSALEVQIIGPIRPSDDDLRAYYEANLSTYGQAEEAHAAHILVDSEGLAVELKRRIDEAADFADLAGQYSRDEATKDAGGDLGWFGRGTMSPEFEQVTFVLDAGQVSDPVETDSGWHLIWLKEKREATPFDEIKDEVRAGYNREESERRISEWYASEAEASDVDIALPVLRAYDTYVKDSELGLAEYERLHAEGSVADPYLPYYIGRIYETKAAVVFSERRTLEEIEMPTEEDLKRIDELKTQQSAFEARALALYLETLERVSADERFLNRILWLNTDSTTETFLLGKLYAVRGDPLAAEGRFEKALEEDPAYVQALVASGDLAVDQRNYPFAKLRYQAALDLRSQDVGILLKLVNVHLASDKLADAAVTIDRIRDLDPTNVRLRIAEGDLAANRLKAAVKEQEMLLETESRTEADEARMAQLETKIAEEYETARSKYDDALRSGGAEEVRVKLGYVHLLNGEFEEAQREFRLALRGFTYNADAYEGLGDALLQMGDEESALANLELALSHAADARQGERVLRKILEVVPDDTDARLLYAGALAAQYKWSDAIREYGRVLDKNADSVDAYVGIARAYLERAEHEAALGYLWQGLRRETSAEERETLYTAVVDVIADEVGPSAPFPPEGLDAVIEIARLRLADDDRETALQYLMWLQDMDEEYRKDVVRSLIVAAGGEVPPSAEEDDLPENGD